MAKNTTYFPLWESAHWLRLKKKMGLSFWDIPKRKVVLSIWDGEYESGTQLFWHLNQCLWFLYVHQTGAIMYKYMQTKNRNCKPNTRIVRHSSNVWVYTSFAPFITKTFRDFYITKLHSKNNVPFLYALITYYILTCLTCSYVSFMMK